MSEHRKKSSVEDDLLANAIPIDDVEDIEEADELEVVEEEPVEAVAEEVDSIDLTDIDPSAKPRKIQSLDQHDHNAIRWKRKPVMTGQGACHVRTFVTKLRLDAIDHLDEQINAWLDENPEYEIKFVSTTVGILVGKVQEQALFVNVWV